MKFKFKAENKEKKVVAGEKEAPDKFHLYDLLKGEGLTLLSAETENKKRKQLSFLKKLFKRFSVGSVPVHQKIIFMKNLGAMIEAGLSLSKSLIVLERQIKNPTLKKITEELNESVKTGKPLSEGMEKFPHIFSGLVISMIKAGEEGGNLSESLKTTTIQLERMYYIKRKVKGAMMYPAVIVSLIIVVGILMLVYIVPKLTETFQDLDVELPFSTRMIIFISDFFQNHYLLAFLIIASIISLIIYFFKSPRYKKFFDIFFLKMPILGEMVRETNSARASRTISSLVSSGVNLTNALEITADVVQNSVFQKILIKAKDALQKGENLSATFGQEENVYPPFFVEMVAAGEETGNLSGMLLDVAIFYENEIDQKTKDMSTIIEPIIMIFIGSAVGFFAYAMLTPMYSMMGSIG